LIVQSKIHKKMKRLALIFMLCQLAASMAFSQNNWKGIGQFNSGVISLYPNLSSDKLFLGGMFKTINSDTIIGVAGYDGFNFEAMGCGMDWNCDTPVNVFSATLGFVNDFIEFNGELYITGRFQFSNNKLLNGIARWTGSDWEPLNTGLKLNSGSNGFGQSLKMINNELYVVGVFDSCAGVACNSIAKFDGVHWSAVHHFPKFDNNDAPNLLTDVDYYNNEIYVVGNFYDQNNMNGDLWRITRFNGNSWVPVKNGIKGGFANVNKLLVANNLLYLCGSFSL
jgi:hypothetical protein